MYNTAYILQIIPVNSNLQVLFYEKNSNDCNIIAVDYGYCTG